MNPKATVYLEKRQPMPVTSLLPHGTESTIF